jgi:RNA polymerase sigma-32 factor
MARSIHEEPGLLSFVQNLDRFAPLEREQELELARRYRDQDDQAAAEQLVQSHLKSVVKMAHKYRGYGIYLSDLIAEGNLGLLEAVRRFEPERGLRFLTYARYWIRAYMLAHILKHWSIVDLGTTALQSKMFFKLQAEHARLSHELGSDEDQVAERLADKFDTSVDNVRASLARLKRRDTSLDVPVMAESKTTFGEMLADESLVDQEQLAASAELADLVHDAIARVWPGLDCRERLILRERLLPENNDDPKTLASLGDRLGVTRERVRQLEVGVKDKLRRTIEGLEKGAEPVLTAGADGSGCGNCPSELCAA